MAHLVFSVVDSFSTCKFCNAEAVGYIFIEEIGLLRAFCGEHIDGMINHYLDNEKTLALMVIDSLAIAEET